MEGSGSSTTNYDENLSLPNMQCCPIFRPLGEGRWIRRKFHPFRITNDQPWSEQLLRVLANCQQPSDEESHCIRHMANRISFLEHPDDWALFQKAFPHFMDHILSFGLTSITVTENMERLSEVYGLRGHMEDNARDQAFCQIYPLETISLSDPMTGHACAIMVHSFWIQGHRSFSDIIPGEWNRLMSNPEVYKVGPQIRHTISQLACLDLPEAVSLVDTHEFSRCRFLKEHWPQMWGLTQPTHLIQILEGNRAYPSEFYPLHGSYNQHNHPWRRNANPRDGVPYSLATCAYIYQQSMYPVTYFTMIFRKYLLEKRCQPGSLLEISPYWNLMLRSYATDLAVHLYWPHDTPLRPDPTSDLLAKCPIPTDAGTTSPSPSREAWGILGQSTPISSSRENVLEHCCYHHTDLQGSASSASRLCPPELTNSDSCSEGGGSSDLIECRLRTVLGIDPEFNSDP